MLGSGQNTGTQKCKRHVPCSLQPVGVEWGIEGVRGTGINMGVLVPNPPRFPCFQHHLISRAHMAPCIAHASRTLCHLPECTCDGSCSCRRQFGEDSVA